MGDNSIDTGYMRLRNVRIPRENMLMKRQEVLPDGTYVKKSSGVGKNKKLAERMSYLTMMGARAGMAGGAASALQRSVTTAVRYSCVRKQGFLDTKGGAGHLAPENAVIDYQMQSYRLFKWLSTAYAFMFTGKAVVKQMSEVTQKLIAGDTDAGDVLQEMHATSAGMKALCCTIAGDGMEDCRQMLGGHGYLMNSGVAADLQDYVWKITAEGDPIVMYLQVHPPSLCLYNRIGLLAPSDPIVSTVCTFSPQIRPSSNFWRNRKTCRPCALPCAPSKP